MLRIFQIAQDHDADIHPHALKRITRALPFMGAQTREDREANELFLSILTSRKNPERILRLMNESGVLGKFLPDFGRIVAMMQFDMYHSYTVDEHTIKTIGVLHQIESNELAKTAPVATHGCRRSNPDVPCLWRCFCMTWPRGGAAITRFRG